MYGAPIKKPVRDTGIYIEPVIFLSKGTMSVSSLINKFQATNTPAFHQRASKFSLSAGISIPILSWLSSPDIILNEVGVKSSTNQPVFVLREQFIEPAYINLLGIFINDTGSFINVS